MHESIGKTEMLHIRGTGVQMCIDRPSHLHCFLQQLQG